MIYHQPCQKSHLSACASDAEQLYSACGGHAFKLRGLRVHIKLIKSVAEIMCCRPGNSVQWLCCFSFADGRKEVDTVEGFLSSLQSDRFFTNLNIKQQKKPLPSDTILIQIINVLCGCTHLHY